uniref:BLOC-1-related complex subunit 5 n=1 Tax=Rhabditophanes sp. KR3021 TaxID=114890 RepID=A0AC35UCV9_9BILA
MGNEVSTSTSNSSLRFFSNRSQSHPPGSTMVTVNSGATKEQDPKDDPDYIKLQEIRRFLPIMKFQSPPMGSAQRDSYKQINPRLLLSQFSELHMRLHENARFIQHGQVEVFNKVKAADHDIYQIMNDLKDREALYKKMTFEMGNLKLLSQNINDLHTDLENMIHQLDEITSHLPIDIKPPGLDFDKLLRDKVNNINSPQRHLPAFEYSVVDNL